jgi:DNA-directed RNA polymerase specialized sigma24 family protein
MTQKPPEPSAPFEESLAEALPVVYARLAARFRDEQLADEVSADCLVSAWEKHAADPDYFRAHDLTAWSSRRASWKAVDRLRQRVRLRPLPQEPDGPGEGVRARRPNAPEALARDRQLALECLQRLPEQERAVLVGHYFEGKTDVELGTALFGERGTPQARGLKVWRLRQKARTRLRDLLLAEGVDPSDWGGPGGLAV